MGRKRTSPGGPRLRAGGKRTRKTDCCCSCCKKAGGPPTADFTYEQTDDDPCCFEFSDTSVAGNCGEIVAWHWDFGDDTSSTQQNPTKCYSGSYPSGPWNVTLTVTDSEGCQDVAEAEVTCNELCDCEADGPTADFTYEQTDDDPCCFAFTDDSVAGECGEIVEWLWDFGDDTTSTQQNPTKCYTGSQPGGLWDVTLTVTDSEGCQDSVQMQIRCVPEGEGLNCCDCQPFKFPCSFDVTLANFGGFCTPIDDTYHCTPGGGDPDASCGHDYSTCGAPLNNDKYSVHVLMDSAFPDKFITVTVYWRTCLVPKAIFKVKCEDLIIDGDCSSFSGNVPLVSYDDDDCLDEVPLTPTCFIQAYPC